MLRVLAGLLNLGLILGIGLLLAMRDTPLPAHWDPTAPFDPRAPETLVSWFQFKRAAGSPALCRAALARGGATIAAIEDRELGPGCHIRDAVRLSGLGTMRLAPVTTRCEIALRMLVWARHDLTAAAARFLPSPVSEIDHLGSYSCRQIRGSSGFWGARMSQHATANAIDIAGFRLADGQRIRLSQHWTGGDARARFLRAARDGLCRRFNTVLSPDYNGAHFDHFHADQGVFATCR